MRELEEVRRANGGLLAPRDVVKYARDPKHELHREFMWDNERAGHRYRLMQARKMITHYTVTLSMPAQGRVEKMRGYVALSTDRPRGGYRALVEILRDEHMTAQMLEDALASLSHWQKRYQRVTELTPIFEAAERVRRESAQRPARGRRREASRGAGAQPHG